MMVDTANILAELARDDLASGQLARDAGIGPAPLASGAQSVINTTQAPGPAVAPNSRFSQHVQRYANRPIAAGIWGFSKQSLDYRIYITDDRGIVLFDSENRAVGADYSQWRDVALTLRGEYGARSTADTPGDATSTAMHVAAPIMVDGRIAGVLTVVKPNKTVQRFIDRSEKKVLTSGLLLLALSAAVGVGVTLWVVWNVRRLRDYALSVQGPSVNFSATDHEGGGVAHTATSTAITTPLAMPRVSGELGELARAMARMQARLEGRDYIEAYVRALTHELKSPVAAIRGAGELLQDNLPDADRAQFAHQVVEQSERLQRIIDRLLELSKLEQRPHAQTSSLLAQQTTLHDCAQTAIAHINARAAQRDIAITLTGHSHSGSWEAELVTLAITNLLDNAVDFSPSGSTITVMVEATSVTVQDTGPGVPAYALPRLGERFFTTARPGGERSGSGLGLAIVQRIMVMHGGRMVVSNTTPGLKVTLDFQPQ
jgi:two-component system, OmpR family, sensor histidine kinase CreC